MNVTADINLEATDTEEMKGIIRTLDQRLDLVLGTRDSAIRNVGLAVTGNEPEVAARWLAVANEAQAEFAELQAARYNLNNRLVALVTGCPQAPSI